MNIEGEMAKYQLQNIGHQSCVAITLSIVQGWSLPVVYHDPLRSHGKRNQQEIKFPSTFIDRVYEIPEIRHVKISDAKLPHSIK
ncbi:hypothetical protein [Niabella hirudinis]|uniref:hypothetical protein n=1 Tax=Niabella hirudinis TaxID=1285929 RepID=UPI003EBA7F7F